MGCVASKLEEEEVVAICKERKSQLKLAVERRYALAEAHCKYFHSLYAVAAAIKLFVARHSSPSSPFLITFPPPCCPTPSEKSENNVINNPMFLQQAPCESKHEAIACDSCASSSLSSTTSESESAEEEEEEKEDEVQRQEEEHHQVEQPFGYYYMHMQPPPPTMMPSPQRDFGWDFFNPFEGMRNEVISGYRRNSDDDLRVVREEEGIPELEEEGERDDYEEKVVTLEENNEGVVVENGNGNNVETGNNVLNVVNESESHVDPKGLTVLDTQEEGRELLDALKDIEDHFIRAYDSGKDVSRMLEANRIPLQSGLEEIKGGSSLYLQIL